MNKPIQEIAKQLGMDSDRPWAFLIRRKAEEYEVFYFKDDPLNPHLSGKWGACFIEKDEGHSHGLGMYESVSSALKACEFHDCWSSDSMAPFIDQFS